MPPDHDLLNQINQATGSYQFNFVDWETHALGSELTRRWWPPPLPETTVNQHALVQTFLKQEEDIRELRRELEAIYAVSDVPDPTVQTLEQALAQTKHDQAEITPQIEAILAQQLESVLRDEGFTIAGQVFTPLAFRFIDPPTALILSPRDHIENIQFIGLRPGLENNIRATLEDTLDQRGDVSSYVTDIGGLGSYPTMVISYPFLPWLVEVIAHEWTHNYLFSFPTNIAWGYSTYPRLRTINETTADIVGQEIGRAVITRYYPDWIDHLPPLDETGFPALTEPSEFEVAMRHIHLHVDDLLAEGKIEEAEIYMEAERLKLVEKGYNLRKLNQAYFAFHGSYALSPASVDPTGSQLRQLRAKSPSLKAFVDRVGWLNSYDNFLVWLQEAGVE